MNEAVNGVPTVNVTTEEMLLVAPFTTHRGGLGGAGVGISVGPTVGVGVGLPVGVGVTVGVGVGESVGVSVANSNVKSNAVVTILGCCQYGQS